LAGAERGRLAVTVLLAAGTGAAGAALLATSAWLITRAAERPPVVALGLAIIGVRFCALARGACRYLERLVGHDTALRSLATLRVRVYERLEALAPTGLPAFRRGDLLARLVQDVDTLQDLTVRVLPPIGAVGVVGLVATGLVWHALPSAGLVLGLGLAVGAIAVPLWTRHAARRRATRQAAARGELSAAVIDLLEGAPELAAFGGTEAQLARVAAADAELTRITTATSFAAGAGAGMVTAATGAVVWAILLVGVPAVRAGRLSAPLLALAALVPLAVFELVQALPPAAQSLERVRQSAARVGEVTHAEPLVVDPPAPVAVPDGPHTLRIRGLRCRYGPDGPWTLHGLDLDLPPGRRVAIVGPSGAGKSTLAAVLLRFLPYEHGSVTLDGVELEDMAGEDVRRVIGLADQDTYLFSTTLRGNMTVAAPGADDAAVMAALAQARLGDWVEELPSGLGALAGGHEAGMSGGQRQRLGIARVLLARFPVLVLDEPGEHLDTATADALVRDLTDVTRGRTTVLITHRLAGLESMDEILVLDGGRVVERGTHDRLIAGEGPYAAQWLRERWADAVVRTAQ
jgi:thiol reductant ABC exporter CydC subunit